MPAIGVLGTRWHGLTLAVPAHIVPTAAIPTRVDVTVVSSALIGLASAVGVAGLSSGLATTVVPRLLRVPFGAPAPVAIAPLPPGMHPPGPLQPAGLAVVPRRVTARTPRALRRGALRVSASPARGAGSRCQ